MATLILALALMCQPPDPAAGLARWMADRAPQAIRNAGWAGASRPAPPTDGPPTREDLEFQAAVEDFARPAPPEPWRSMVDALGSSAWKDREAASKALESAARADRSAARWLFAGRRHADPEVRLRCNTILRRLHPCGECKGRTPEQREWMSCDRCGDTLSAWPYSLWD